jgi:hypothetical protein
LDRACERLAPLQDVWPVLVGGVRGLFARDGAASEEAADRAVAKALFRERSAQLFNRNGGRRSSNSAAGITAGLHPANSLNHAERFGPV